MSRRAVLIVLAFLSATLCARSIWQLGQLAQARVEHRRAVATVEPIVLVGGPDSVTGVVFLQVTAETPRTVLDVRPAPGATWEYPFPLVLRVYRTDGSTDLSAIVDESGVQVVEGCSP